MSHLASLLIKNFKTVSHSNFFCIKLFHAKLCCMFEVQNNILYIPVENKMTTFHYFRHERSVITINAPLNLTAPCSSLGPVQLFGSQCSSLGQLVRCRATQDFCQITTRFRAPTGPRMLRLALLFLSSAVLAPPPDTAGTRNATASPQQAFVPPKYAPPSSFLPGVPTPNAAAFAARQQQPSYAPGGASPAPATPMDQQQPSYAPGGTSPAPATPMDQQQPSYAPGGASPAPGPVSPSNPSYGAVRPPVVF